MNVYLAGRIAGCSDSECNDWRSSAKSLLNCNTLDPMVRDGRNVKMTPEIAKSIVEGDKLDIDNSDIVLVYYEKPSVGTSMEILYAWQEGTPVIIVSEKETSLSPWLTYHSYRIFKSLEEACKAINEMEKQYEDEF